MVWQTGRLEHEKGGCPARPCSPMHPRVLDRTLWVAFEVGKTRHKEFGFVAPGHSAVRLIQGQATKTAPSPISSTPTQPRPLSCSPSTHTPSTATSTTLSLSMGATRDTGPSWSAWK